MLRPIFFSLHSGNIVRTEGVFEEFSTIAFCRHPKKFHGGREEYWSRGIPKVPGGPVVLNVLSATGAHDQTELID
jgi:hypothetical protein